MRWIIAVLAAYVLTDRPVIDALHAAKARGVAVRLLLDPSQRHDLARLGDPSRDRTRTADANL